MYSALSVLTQFKAAAKAAQDSSQDVLKLIALETRLAALSLGVIIALSVLVGALILSAWLMLWGAVSIFLVEIGLSWFWALLLISIIHLALAFGCALFAYKLSCNLRFDVSRSLIELKPE